MSRLTKKKKLQSNVKIRNISIFAILCIVMLFSCYFFGVIGSIIFKNHNTNSVEACVIITNGYGHGSGVHIGDGIILTAGHCIGIDGAWIIANDGRTYSIIDQWADPYDEDIGFMIIRDKELPSLSLGNMPNVGDKITVIGTPLTQSFSFNVTSGIVSKLYVDWLCWYGAVLIDAATYGGNSGGPVLNTNNEIIAILVSGPVGTECLSVCESVENIKWSLESFLEYLEEK